MKICPKCQSEFEDTVSACADDGTALMDADTWRAERQKKAERLAENTRFVQAAEADDPFDAEAYAAAVDEVGIPVMTRSRKTGTMDVLVAAGGHAYWEILVPADQLAAAQKAIANRKSELATEEMDAGQAAEAEEEATHGHVVVAELEDEDEAIHCVDRLSTSGITAVLRGQTDIEADTVDDHGRDGAKIQVLVPLEHGPKAKELLAKPA